MTSPIEVDVLEARAAEQRRELHHSVSELRQSVRETLDVRRQVRSHFAPAAGAAAVLGLILGYGFISIFKD
jgi:hypothetical protein